ncbi:hypothetical protein FRC04_009117 [Tulasnella sp. 424]|nr:hypothetical protein FRC04_009117 [Tulasnella sp. 424]KAG8974686.1 hypothetical protein FRC05_007020 [Tulasnella sp. 425]
MAGYHPLLFILLTAVGAAELGLVAYLIHTFDKNGYPDGKGGYTSRDFKARLDFIMFCACWTVFFGLAYIAFMLAGALFFLASIASSALWLIITVIFWAIGAALFMQVRVGGNCHGTPAISLCRELQTVEALGWTALGLAAFTFIVSLIAIHATRRKHGYRGTYYDYDYSSY